MRAWGIPRSSRRSGAEAWLSLCYALSLAEDLDDPGEVLDLLRASRTLYEDKNKWWSDMMAALRPIMEESPDLLELLGLPAAPNPLTLALSVAKNMKVSPAARAGWPT